MCINTNNYLLNLSFDSTNIFNLLYNYENYMLSLIFFFIMPNKILSIYLVMINIKIIQTNLNIIYERLRKLSYR